MGDVVNVRGTEGDPVTYEHPPMTKPAAARDPVPLHQAALGYRERPG